MLVAVEVVYMDYFLFHEKRGTTDRLECNTLMYMSVAQSWDEMMGKQAENKRLTSSIYSSALYEYYITKKYFRIVCV